MARVVSSIAVMSLVAFGSVLGLSIEAGAPLEIVNADRNLGSANANSFNSYDSFGAGENALRPILEKAEEKVAKDLASQRRLEANGGSKRRHYSRTTPESVAMDLENAIVATTVEELSKESPVNPETVEQVWSEIQEQQREAEEETGNGRSKRQTLPSGIAQVIRFTCGAPQRVNCDAAEPFRSITGVCNNLAQPKWGTPNKPMLRYVPADYEDGLGVPRGGFFSGSGLNNDLSGRGRRLPNPRVISTTFHPDRPADSRRHTLMVMQFGQYLDHDITFTAESSLAEHCCEDRTSLNRECFPISVPNDDIFFGRQRRDCINFGRSSAYCQRPDTTREQMNALTGFVDASHTYGSDDFHARSMRLFFGGMLKSSVRSKGRENKEFLPVDPQGHFFSGDIRGTEMPGLAAVHTIFLREHNRVARALFRLRRDWSDEQLYQNARRIVIAQWQNAVYGEYLPEVLGSRAMKRFRLGVTSRRSKYDPKEDPTIKNAFATAAFRFGHTQIQGIVRMMSATNNVTETYQLRHKFFSMEPYLAHNGDGMEYVLKGILTQAGAADDRFVSADVTNFLFPGVDLVARNIQRGRDHGLPGYNAFRSFCGLPTSNSWSRAPSFMSNDLWRRLSALYAQPDDIDLFTAGLAETVAPGAAVGPTFQCLLASQFASLKAGDRFFFTHFESNGVTNAFNDAQLRAIKSRSLRDVLCENTDIFELQLNVFRLGGRKVPCSQRNELDLGLFV